MIFLVIELYSNAMPTNLHTCSDSIIPSSAEITNIIIIIISFILKWTNATYYMR